MAGARQKPPDQLTNRRGGRGRSLVVALDADRRVPRLPTAPKGEHWCRAARAVWREFWMSPVSAAVDEHADAERLRRWVTAIHERELLLEKVRDEGWVGPWGSHDQDVEHPSLSYVKHLDRELARFAEHFGLTPLSRFRLQITYSQAGQEEDKLARLQARRERERESEPAPTAARVIDLE